MEDIEQRFQWAVQALSQPAEIQRILYPSFVVVADELALDFDNSRRACEYNLGDSWSHEQRQAVTTLDHLLNEMSGPERPELWLDERCLDHPKWSDVRRLAANVLAAFDWLPGVPPKGRSLYVPYAPSNKLPRQDE